MTTIDEFPKLLSPEQVGKIYGVDSKTVSRWADEGRLKHIRTPGGHRRFFEEEIMENIRATTQGGVVKDPDPVY